MVRNVLSVIENSKNFNWYYKWVDDNRPINLTKFELDMTDEYYDLKPEIKEKKIEILTPSAQYLNKNFRYVSGVTYDCSNAVWNRVVSVPFIFTNGTIRFLFLI